jgi:hypothetical protein
MGETVALWKKGPVDNSKKRWVKWSRLMGEMVAL